MRRRDDLSTFYSPWTSRLQAKAPYLPFYRVRRKLKRLHEPHLEAGVYQDLDSGLDCFLSRPYRQIGGLLLTKIWDQVYNLYKGFKIQPVEVLWTVCKAPNELPLKSKIDIVSRGGKNGGAALAQRWRIVASFFSSLLPCAKPTVLG